MAALPEDLEIRKTHVVALIHLGRYEEALAAVPSGGLDFEKAYLLYKLGMYQEALKLSVSRSEKPFRLLKAQSVSFMQYFRLALHKEAVAEYQDLLKADSENSEIKINLSGCSLAPGFYDLSLSHALLMHCNDWEILFNKACALTEVKQYSEALSTLRTTERLVAENKHLSEEVWLVKAQIGYVFQCLQEKEKALDIYEEILKSKAEANIKAVTKNNWVVLKNCDSKIGIKILNEALGEENKLLPLQKLGILENIGLISYKKRKVAEAYAAVDLCEKIDGESERVGFFKTYVLYKEKKHEEYKTYLLSKEKPWAYGLLMKLLLEQHRLQEAEAVFESMSKGRKQLLDSEDYLEISQMLEKAGMVNRASEILEEACKNYSSKELWARWGSLLRKSDKPERAIQIFEEYLAKNPDTGIIANLVLAAASFKPEVALKWSSKLQRVNLKALYNSANSVESLDEIIDKLEFANLQWKPKVDEKIVSEIIPKKRKRKTRYPKGFDPKNPNNPKPDPERWIPKNERKEFKKKSRKKQQKMKGPQGVVLAEAQGQEIGGFNKNPSTAHTPAVGEIKKKQKRRGK